MKQRIGIAQALLNDPKVLIFDEPTVGLDPKKRVRFRNLISDLASDCIIILSSHIVSDIETIADEVAIMRNGVLIMKGTQAEVMKKTEGKVFEIIIENQCWPNSKTSTGRQYHQAKKKSVTRSSGGRPSKSPHASLRKALTISLCRRGSTPPSVAPPLPRPPPPSSPPHGAVDSPSGPGLPSCLPRRESGREPLDLLDGTAKTSCRTNAPLKLGQTCRGRRGEPYRVRRARRGVADRHGVRGRHWTVNIGVSTCTRKSSAGRFGFAACQATRAVTVRQPRPQF